MTSAAQQILRRIRGKGRGWVFTPQDFVDIATRGNTDMILHRQVQDGHIRRIGRGLYDYPQIHDKLGMLAPDTKAIAQAVARQTGDTISLSGATAANLLGLSTQVPGKVVYVTTGKPKKIPVGKRFISLVSSRIPPALLQDDTASLTLRALDHLGSKYVDRSTVQKCAQNLSDADKARLRQNLRYIKGSWLNDVARQLAA